MIISLTPNPSLDRTLSVVELVPGSVQIAVSEHLEPGGKGVNVTRALANNGQSSIAVLPLGGPHGNVLAHLLDEELVNYASVIIADGIRSNITIVDDDGTETKINEAGPVLTEAEQQALLTRVRGLAPFGAWIVCSGSLPLGVSEDFYAELARTRPPGSRVAVDSSGGALRAAVDARVDLIKPNLLELAELVDRPLLSVKDALAAAIKVRDGGVGLVLVSLGHAGALMVGQQVLHCRLRKPMQPRNTVGAGDALLAGFLAAGGDAHEALGRAVRWATAACETPGTRMPTLTTNFEPELTFSSPDEDMIFPYEAELV